MRKSLLLFCLSLALGLTLFLLNGLGRVAQAGPQSKANLVIQFSPTDHLVREIGFSEPTLTGLQALSLSGVEVVTATNDWGVAVCSIGGVGCPADNCFCSPDHYWMNSAWDGSAWQMHSTGAAETSLSHGAVDGWAWVDFAMSDPLLPATPALAAQAALGYIQAQQVITNGSYGGPGASTEALLAVGANRLPAAAWRRPGAAFSLGEYLSVAGARYANSGATAAGKMAVALNGARGCWPKGAQGPLADYDPATGLLADGSGLQAWAILGALARGETVPTLAVQTLKGQAMADGGWEWMATMGTDTNTTSLVIQALIAAGEPVTSTVITQAFSFLDSAQNTDGGFAYDPKSPWGTASDANSTAYALLALSAAGLNFQQAPWGDATLNPLTYLLSLQLPDGSFEWQEGLGANLLSTQQVVAALLSNPFPGPAREFSSCPGAFLPNVANRNAVAETR